MHWLNNHPDRETILAEMRLIRAESDCQFKIHHKIRPNGSEIAVGGAHMDSFAKAEGLASFLSCLSRGETPQTALAVAQEDSKEVWVKWNSRRKDYQVHRWPQTTYDYLAYWTSSIR